MKSFKAFMSEAGKVGDDELEVKIGKVKYDKGGSVKDFNLDLVLLTDRGDKKINNRKLTDAITRYMGYDFIKSAVEANPKGNLITFEVYVDENGSKPTKYIVLDKKRHTV